jgi:hypothetical protein
MDEAVTGTISTGLAIGADPRSARDPLERLDLFPNRVEIDPPFLHVGDVPQV